MLFTPEIEKEEESWSSSEEFKADEQMTSLRIVAAPVWCHNFRYNSALEALWGKKASQRKLPLIFNMHIDTPKIISPLSFYEVFMEEIEQDYKQSHTWE